ncbi:MAG: PAS domain S-box protein, partial [Deltaproteobacteria bacterium]
MNDKHATTVQQGQDDGDKQSHNDAALLKAVSRSFAVIEFDPQGQILAANESFLRLMGYGLDEVVGKHHRIFCDPLEAASPQYTLFWEKLRRGEFDAGVYRRVRKDGRDAWIQATYNPVLNDQGRVEKVVKFALDVTEQKALAADAEGKLAALGRSQAVIEFDPEGVILNANGNFLKTMGYRLDEIKGRHHRIFCDPKYVETIDYRKLWDKLRRGEPDQGEYKRLGQDCREVWLQANYNPITDASGKVVRVIKFATDITEQKLRASEAQSKVDAIEKSQAVIEFRPDGTIL